MKKYLLIDVDGYHIVKDSNDYNKIKEHFDKLVNNPSQKGIKYSIVSNRLLYQNDGNKILKVAD